MYTRCTQCATVFRVGAGELRIAHGTVRCGNCAAVFNALGNLMDEIPDPDDEETRVGTEEWVPTEAPEAGDVVAGPISEPEDLDDAALLQLGNRRVEVIDAEGEVLAFGCHVVLDLDQVDLLRFGAQPDHRVMYVQSMDRFQQDLLEMLATDRSRRNSGD